MDRQPEQTEIIVEVINNMNYRIDMYNFDGSYSIRKLPSYCQPGEY